MTKKSETAPEENKPLADQQAELDAKVAAFNKDADALSASVLEHENAKAEFENQKAKFEKKQAEHADVVAMFNANFDAKLAEFEKKQAEHAFAVERFNEESDAKVTEFETQKAEHAEAVDEFNADMAKHEKDVRRHQDAVDKHNQYVIDTQKAHDAQGNAPGMPQHWIDYKDNGEANGLSFAQAMDICLQNHGSIMYRAAWKPNADATAHKIWRISQRNTLVVHDNDNRLREPKRLYTDHLFTDDWVVSARSYDA